MAIEDYQSKTVTLHTSQTGMVQFTVVTNLPDKDFEAAVDCWAARTSDFTMEDLCGYVMSKGIHGEIHCVPEKLHEALIKWQD